MGNWLDLVFLLALALALFGGLRRGLLRELVDLAALTLAFFLNTRYGDRLAISLSTYLPVGFGLARLLALLLLWGGSVWLLRILAGFLSHFIPASLGLLNSLGGGLFALARQVLLITIILNLLAGLPLIPATTTWQESALLPDFLALMPVIIGYGQRLWPNFPWPESLSPSPGAPTPDRQPRPALPPREDLPSGLI